MKKCALRCALAASIMVSVNAKASEFDGFYVQINSGYNKSTATGLPDKNHRYTGGVAGYNWDYQNVLFGVNGYIDNHKSSYTRRDYGMDMKVGLPMMSFLPYAKLGFITTQPGSPLNGSLGSIEENIWRWRTGLGIEYKFAQQWSANGEWTRDKLTCGGRNCINNNFVIGLNYYFEGSSNAAAPREAAAREAAVREAAFREAAFREAAFREDAIREGVARELAAREAMARTEAARAEKSQIDSASEKLIAPEPEKMVRIEGADFAPGTSKLLKSARSKLDEVVNIANQSQDVRLEVKGYSDHTGDTQKNIMLSLGRAEAVKWYLVKKGVSAKRIMSKGLGSQNPIADNATAEGREMNRRVEIHYRHTKVYQRHK